MFQDPVDKQCHETSEKMCSDPTLSTEIYWLCFKFGFHYPEAFLNLPSALHDVDDLFRFILQISARFCSSGIGDVSGYIAKPNKIQRHTKNVGKFEINLQSDFRRHRNLLCGFTLTVENLRYNQIILDTGGYFLLE